MVAATYVKDIEASRAFYALLGFEEQSAGHSATTTWSSLNQRDHIVLLVSSRPAISVPRLPLLFYFYFDDLGSVLGALEAADVKYTHLGYPPHTPAGEAKVLDPDGNTILLGQQEPSTSWDRRAQATAPAAE